jgi:DeoR family transcriptional regulator of aga operon
MSAAADAATRDTSERRRRITAMLSEHGSVQVLALADEFGVSAQTIRKDLQYLEARGVATRSYGGAISAHVIGGQQEAPVETKRVLHASEKEAIGRRAAALVVPGDSIILDSGTTTALIARHMPDSEDITVVTNDAGVLSELIAKKHIQVVMLGGALRRRNLAFYGGQTLAAMSELSVNKLFLGVDGFDLEHGITTHFEAEAQLNRLMVKSATQVIAVTDSSKFGRKCLHRIASVEELDVLVTDRQAPQPLLEAAQGVGIEVLVA